LVIGPGGVLDNTGGTIALNASTGNLTLAGGTLAGGTVTATGGAKVLVSGPGTSTLDGVVLMSDLDLTDPNANLDIDSSVSVTGSATVGGSLFVGAGDAIQISGALALESSASVEAVFGGTAPGQSGAIAVGGPATLAGILDVSPAQGLIPIVGESLPLMTFVNHTGKFGQTIGLGSLDGLTLSLVYDTTDVTLKTS
jgi:hypothetical protein